MNTRFSLNFFTVMLISTTLACSLLTSLTNKVGEVKGTAQSVATLAGEGQTWISTAQAVVTDIGKSGLLETAQSYATEIGGSSILQTAQAYSTQQAPQILETAQSVASQMPPNTGEVPEDIPIITGEKEDLFASPNLVSYISSQDYASVVQFYKNEMPVKGWEFKDKDSVETSNVAYLQFKKQDQSASVVISINPANNKTVVMITLQ